MDQSGDRTLIAVDVVDDALRPHMLKTKQICRLCLTQDAPLGPIFPSTGANSRSKQPPLSLQIMACASIEVYREDGLPGMICDNCQVLLKYCYKFRKICKDADAQLKLFYTTGIWPEKIQLPKELMNLAQNTKEIYVKTSPNISTKTGAKTTSPIVESEPEQNGKKINIIKLSPNDLKNLKLSNRVNLGSSTELSPVVSAKMDREQNGSIAAPLQTSTPFPKRGSVLNQSNRQGSRVQIYETTACPAQMHSQPKKEKKSPVILNKLASAYMAQKVKEEFFSIGNDTVMILNYEPEAVAPTEPASDNIYPCTECPRTFKLKQLLDLHKLNHKRERNFPCTECEKRFFSKYDLAKHMATHTGERPYVCVICMAAFSRSTLLTRHQASHKADLTHPCIFCSRVFVSQEELAKHTVTHEKRRPFQCNMCSKSFAYKQGLERHAVVHAEVLPHKCEYCEMSFHTSAMLSRHLAAHAGDRPYPCRLCKKSFLLSHHLSRHMRGHNMAEQSEYTCSCCESSFSSLDEMIYHSAKHAKEDHLCPMCHEQLEDSKDAVNEHIQQHITGNKFACDYCDRLYTSQEKLVAHWQEDHGDELAYEWSEEQQKQLNAEQSAASPSGTSVDNTQILIANEEVDSNLLDEQQDTLFLQHDEQTTDSFGEGQTVETIEVVTEFVDMATFKENPKPKENVSPPTKQPVAAKKEAPETSQAILRQKSLEEFYQRNKLAVEKKTNQRNVSDMLERLPKGMTVKREHSAPGAMVNPAKSAPKTTDKRTAEVAVVPKRKDVNPPPPSKETAAVAEMVKRKPGRPPKQAVPDKVENEERKENVATTKKAQPEASKEQRGGGKVAKSEPANKQEKEQTEKKSSVEGGLKRSGTMNFPKNRMGIDGATKGLASASGASAKAPTQMLRRSYAVPSKVSSVGTKRTLERDTPEDEVAVPSKRPALPSNRKTLNPAMLTDAKQKTAAAPSGGAKSPGESNEAKANVVRTFKRASNPDATVGAPVEMNVGGKTIKMQKLILTKEEALALQKSGKLKPAV